MKKLMCGTTTLGTMLGALLGPAYISAANEAETYESTHQLPTQDTKTKDYFPDEALPQALFHIDPAKRDTFIDVGVGGMSLPTYLGSDEKTNLIVPYFNAEYKGRWFINPYLGAGVNIVDNKYVTLSSGLSYIGGRDASETPFDDAQFDIDGSVSGFVNALVGLKYVALDVKASVPFTGDIEGYEFQTRLLTLIPVSDSLRISPGISATFHSADWHDKFYAVTADQVFLTQAPNITYSSGITSLGASLIGFWVPKEKITVVGMVEYRKLDEVFDSSPFVTQSDGLSVILALARRF